MLATVEELAPRSNSHVFTNDVEHGQAGKSEYNRIRSLAERRGSLFLAVMLDCDVDVEVGRIDDPDRVDLRKGSDPDGYRGFRLHTKLDQPPSVDVLHLDTGSTPPAADPARILHELRRRGSTAEWPSACRHFRLHESIRRRTVD